MGLPELPDVLRYHVLNSVPLSSGITDGMLTTTLLTTTLQGKNVRFEVDGDVLRVNGPKIISLDVKTINGVIHVIDAVLIPPVG